MGGGEILVNKDGVERVWLNIIPNNVDPIKSTTSTKIFTKARKKNRESCCHKEARRGSNMKRSRQKMRRTFGAGGGVIVAKRLERPAPLRRIGKENLGRFTGRS